MRYIELKLAVPGENNVTDETKLHIEKNFTVVGQHRLQELWRGQIPPRIKVGVEVGGCCISITDDWECTIFGKSFVQCLLGLSLLHEFLSNLINKPIGMRVLSPTGKEGTVDKLIKSEHIKKKLVTIGWFVLTSVVSGVIGYYLALVLGAKS